MTHSMGNNSFPLIVVGPLQNINEHAIRMTDVEVNAELANMPRLFGLPDLCNVFALIIVG